MRHLLTCLTSLLVLGCATAHDTPPALGTISTDQAGGWLLFTDHRDIDSRTRIYILSTDPALHVTCCAVVLGGATPPPKGHEDFFSNVESDQPSQQRVYHVAVPEGSISSGNPIAMAAWNISNAIEATNGYVLHQANTKQTYEADSCFGSEGLNLYLRNSTRSTPPLAHYYVDFGYEIGAGNCAH